MNLRPVSELDPVSNKWLPKVRIMCGQNESDRAADITCVLDGLFDTKGEAQAFVDRAAENRSRTSENGLQGVSLTRAVCESFKESSRQLLSITTPVVEGQLHDITHGDSGEDMMVENDPGPDDPSKV